MIKAIINAIMNGLKWLKSTATTVGGWVKKGGKWIYEAATETVADMVDETLAMADRGLGVLDWCGDTIARLWPFGGGGGGPAEPKKDIGLPEVDEVKTVKTQAREQQRAANIMLDHPARQIKMWIDGDRESASLSKLSPEQKVWLQQLSESQLLLVKAANDRQIFDALTSKENAIPGIVSFGCGQERMSPLAERIVAFRAGELGLSPASIVH